MAIETRIDEAAYLRLAFAEPDRKWELVDGRLREKPGESFRHNELGIETAFHVTKQLDFSIFQIRVEAGRLHMPEATYYIPDVFAFPVALAAGFLDRDDVLEVYDQPVALVVEVWSRLTGDDDASKKLGAYRQRGDAEVWLLHPLERTLTAWRRQPDGTYEETLHRGGTVHLVALPGVAIDLDALFAG